jgi:CHAT domain-containing protein
MNDVKQAWWWVQRGKARSLSDLLGLGVVLPAALLAQAEEDAEAKRLLQEEDSLIQALGKCSADRRFHLRLQLSKFREKMMKNPALEGILELRSGAAVSLKSLVSLFGERPDVVCVDWATFNDAIMMFTVRPGGDPLMHKLDIKPDYVAKWKKNFLTAETLRDSKAIGWLGRLEPLVAPLAHIVKDGDLLVFSPTGDLSALPLHALCIDGKPIIERHPVIYSSSLSVLRHCVIRRSETASKDSRAMVFGDPSSNRQKAALSATRLANRLNTTPHVGCDATVSAFHQTTETDIIHYHGHATYNNEDPLQSALILSDGNVTAHDIFSIPLRAALVTLIACESAAQEIRTGDEPTGLLPALLYAGANAVVGTLWPLWDTVGGKLSDTFYDTLVSETRNDEKREGVVIDLAKALQKSVLQIRKDRPAPYFWALFVLHGNWKYNKIA